MLYNGHCCLRTVLFRASVSKFLYLWTTWFYKIWNLPTTLTSEGYRQMFSAFLKLWILMFYIHLDIARVWESFFAVDCYGHNVHSNMKKTAFEKLFQIKFETTFPWYVCSKYWHNASGQNSISHILTYKLLTKENILVDIQKLCFFIPFLYPL